jgi:hypothetical protein
VPRADRRKAAPGLLVRSIRRRGHPGEGLRRRRPRAASDRIRRGRGRVAGDEGKDWTAPGFDDSAWNSGPTGIGFGNTAPGFQVIYYKANTTVGDLDTAELVIGNPSYQSEVASETATVINYFNTGSEGHCAKIN